MHGVARLTDGGKHIVKFLLSVLEKDDAVVLAERHVVFPAEIGHHGRVGPLLRERGADAEQKEKCEEKLPHLRLLGVKEIELPAFIVLF